MVDGMADAGLAARPVPLALPDVPGTSDEALLSRFLKMAMPARDEVDSLSATALARFGSFAGLLAAPVRELEGVSGFGTHSLAAIKLLNEAALRLARGRMDGVPILTDTAGLVDYLTAMLARERIEQFRILFLDAEGRLLADEAQARGTVNHTPVYPREVVRRALELQANSIILVHNHPSGDPTPSREDVTMTERVAEACAVLGVVVRDHLIVGNGAWTSFRDQGLLK